MNVVFHKNFERKYKKLTFLGKEKTKERIAMFQDDPFNPILNNHALGGKYRGYRSINITGDMRAIYKITQPDTAVFVVIGTHSNLYK